MACERSSQSFRGVPPRTADVSNALEQWIQGLGGDRALHSVLVANNGLAAVKFIRSVRSWAYKTFGNERAGAWGFQGAPWARDNGRQATGVAPNAWSRPR